MDIEKDINWLYADATMRDGGKLERVLWQMLLQSDPVGAKGTRETMWRYKVGTNKRGDALLWRIDHTGKVQSGKCVAVEVTDGQITTRDIGDIAKTLADAGRLDPLLTPQPTLFGQHLLFGNSKPCVIVSECLQALYLSAKDTTDSAVFLAGDEHDIPDNANMVFGGRSVTLFGFHDSIREKFKGVDIDMNPALSIDVRSYAENLALRLEMTQGKTKETDAYMEKIAKAMQEQTHERLLADNDAYRDLCGRLSLILERQ